jgi:beta-phosphoglucomutase-like phosphatase (HAD superfamily)
MYQVMFDIDGTLLQSYDIDSHCYVEAIKEVTGIIIDTDWSAYQHVTDPGILQAVINKYELQHESYVYKKVKQSFLERLSSCIALNPIDQTINSSSFLSFLQERKDVIVCFATGGWHESAVLKLDSAGINHRSIPIISANSDISRNAIMRRAMNEYQGVVNKCSYFGDGDWDKLACYQLGINFIAVGNRVKHHQRITDFSNFEQLMTYIKL